MLKKQFGGIVALSFPVILYFAYNPATLKLLKLVFTANWIYLWASAILLSLFLSSKATALQLNKLKKQYNIINPPVAVAAYFTGRIIFLFLYELFFRGVLLFSLMAIAGNAISIIINVVLYTTLHACCTVKEIMATIPFGIVICLLCMVSNSVWPAIILHTAVAITTECMIVFSIKKHPKLYMV